MPPTRIGNPQPIFYGVARATSRRQKTSVVPSRRIEGFDRSARSAELIENRRVPAAEVPARGAARSSASDFLAWESADRPFFARTFIPHSDGTR
jgi:hypothetical protein